MSTYKTELYKGKYPCLVLQNGDDKILMGASKLKVIVANLEAVKQFIADQDKARAEKAAAKANGADTAPVVKANVSAIAPSVAVKTPAPATSQPDLLAAIAELEAKIAALNKKTAA